METSVTSYSRGILAPPKRLFSTILYTYFSSFLLCFFQLQAASEVKFSRSQLKATKAKKNGASTMTKCEIGQSLEEFLTQATPDKGLRTLLMCMGEALRTIAFKVRTASCGGTACVNSFGDEQLAVDMLADKLLFEDACSEEVPELQDMGGPMEGGFSVAFDPLDGSSIVDTNFTVGTIFGVWPGDKLTGVTGADQVAAAMGIYGPRTTYVLAVKGFPGTHEFLLLDEGCCSKLVPLGLLVENAGGFSSDGYKSVLDKTIVNLDDRTQVAYGSKNEIIRFEETLYGTSRLKNVPIGTTA
ncbi:hypothetical protein Bca101_045518 [Brassica carinata]